jgi:amidohydrolase
MMCKDRVFSFLCREVDAIAEEILEASRYMFLHPEPCFQEVKAAQKLGDLARNKGFTVKAGDGILSTALRGDRPHREGINIAFLSETDALPMGHACGHNLIAASGIGAAIAFSRAIEEFNLSANAVWYATPAEEGGGGKVLMVDEGWFDDMQYAMMIHPCDRTMVGDYTLACQMINIKYHGVSAHSTGSPWAGCNALTALTQTMSMIDAWRMQFYQSSRVTGYIVNGGRAVNIIPDYTELQYLVRAETRAELLRMIGIIENCADCASRAFGVTAEFEKGVLYDPVANAPVLERYMAESFQMLGETVVDRSTTQAVGSTDMGNVTQKLPGIHGHLKLVDAPTHTEAFMKAAGGKEGEAYVLTAAKAMAMTAALLALDGDCNAYLLR